MVNIFRALDGGHLDRALFGARASRPTSGADGDRTDKTHVSRHGRTEPRRDGPAEDRADPARPAHPDHGS